MLENAQETNSESIINLDSLKKSASCQSETVNRWSVTEIEALFELPFSDLIYKAQGIHRENFDPNAVQVSTLLSIKLWCGVEVVVVII